MKDGPLSKLTITKTGHRPSQFKKISDALPVFCADPVGTDFIPDYPDANLWSTTHHVQVSIVDSTNQADRVTSKRPVRYQMMEQTHVFDANLQKELLSDYKRKFKNKSQEYAKFFADKMALIMILFGQCDEAIKTQIALGATYTVYHQAERLVVFLKRLRTVCFGSDDGGLSYAPYKQVVAVKSMNNFSNNKPYDPRDFKAEVDIKYGSVKAVAGKFPN